MADSNVNNWGRWGDTDQIGTLNLLTPEVVLKAIGLVKKGAIYSLAVPLEQDGPQYPEFHKTWKVCHFAVKHNPEVNFVDDVVTMEAHSGTHIDALGHVWAEGCLYNRFPEDEVSSEGVGKDGIENVRSMVGRGVMLDIPAYRGVDHMGPGEVVTPEDLDGAAAAQGISFQSGDIVLVRTGWYTLFYKDYATWSSSFPGPDGSIVPWLREHDVVAIGADNPTVEAVYTNRPDPSSLHLHALRDLGVYLLENLDLEELARDKVYEFLFIGAPLRLMRASGAPWNPLAMV